MGGNNVDPGVEGRQRRKLGLSAKILIGLLAGIGCGLFFGEYCAPLQVFGDAFVERWAVLAAADGTTDQLYDYWILGRGTSTDPPRWSVIRDVFHWVD